MLKKKINGSWSGLDNVKKKINGTWSDCTSVKKKNNGTWSKVWGISDTRVDLVNARNYLSSDNWYRISYVPARVANIDVESNSLFFSSFGSDVVTSDSSQGSGYWLPVGLSVGESLYIDQRCYSSVSSSTSQSTYTYAILFDGTLSSSTPKKALAKASLTESRQVITLTPTSSAPYLYFYLGFSSSATNYDYPNIYLDIYGIRSDSWRYTFYD